VSYRISAGRSIQILADTREMVTDTLRVMSMGIRQVSRDAGLHLPTFNSKIQKILHSMRTNKSIEVTEIFETTSFCGRFSMQAKLLQLIAFK
jgi:hypothetical protein